MKDYDIRLDVKYGHQEVIDVPALVAACGDRWYNQTLTRVNGSVVRLGVLDGEFHWHRHDADDEFFFVLEGVLEIELGDRTVTLKSGQGTTISKGAMHRPRTRGKTVVLMVETDGIRPTGD